MARPREFDEDAVLDKAMLQFWRHGYEGTSIGDLVAATGIGRQSLYNTFGDKHGVFLRALARYDEKTAALTEPLMTEAAGLAQVRDYVDAALRLQRSTRCSGCLIVRSALELGSDDRKVRAATTRTAKRVRAALAHALETSQTRGELSTDRSPDELADYVFATLNGLAALGSTGTQTAQIGRVVDLMFESIGAAAV